MSFFNQFLVILKKKKWLSCSRLREHSNMLYSNAIVFMLQHFNHLVLMMLEAILHSTKQPELNCILIIQPLSIQERPDRENYSTQKNVWRIVDMFSTVIVWTSVMETITKSSEYLYYTNKVCSNGSLRHTIQPPWGLRSSLQTWGAACRPDP